MTKRHVNWEFAEKVLAAVLPGSSAYLPDRLVGIAGWEPFDVEERDADVIEDDLLGRCAGMAGPLIVVNDTSFDPDQGPYLVDAGDLRAFVKGFEVNVRDYFTNGSVIVVSPVTGLVVAVQDDGLIGTAAGQAVWGASR